MKTGDQLRRTVLSHAAFILTVLLVALTQSSESSARSRKGRLVQQTSHSIQTSCPRGWRGRRLPYKHLGNPRLVCSLRLGSASGKPDTTTILLHGLGGNASDWGKQADIAHHYRDLIRRGWMRSAVLVAVSGGNGYWTDWRDGKHPYARLVVDRLYRHLKHHSNLAKDPRRVALIGVSAGAFGALSLTLRYGERFGRALALSATDLRIALRAKRPLQLYYKVLGRPVQSQHLAAVNPIDLVRSGRPLPSRIVLRWGGREPPKFRRGGELLRSAIERRLNSTEGLAAPLASSVSPTVANTILSAAEVPRGRHGWKSWRQQLGAALDALWRP